MTNDRSRLQVGEGWIQLEITSEPNVIQTVRGYAPFIVVVEVGSRLDYDWLIGAKSISDALEPLRQNNGDLFTGIHIRVKRASKDRFAPYEIESL